ncbi:MAG: zinc ribbon domain-containing protein [Candidatus Hodarchaeota archaeon]
MLNKNTEMSWYSFGKNVRVAAVFSILIVIPYFAFIANLILLIFVCVAISNIKRVNQQLRDPYLSSFTSKYLAAAIIKFIGLIILNIGGVIIAGRYILGYSYSYSYFPYLPYPFSLLVTPVFLTTIIPGCILMTIGCSIEKGGWEDLKGFFYNSKDKFSPNIYINGSEGASTLSSAALLWAIGFLIVPIAIGYIMYIVGYFKLSSLAEGGPTFTTKPVAPPAPKVPPKVSVPPPIPESPYSSTVKPQISMNYCPHCGTELEQGGRYCGTCGSPLNEN